MSSATKLGIDCEGATAIEYALMASAIAGVIVAIVLVLGIKVSAGFEGFNALWTAR